MLEPKDYQKFIDEDINPGDYIVRVLDGQFLVGQVVELSPDFYRYKVLNAFPLGEGLSVIMKQSNVTLHLFGSLRRGTR